MTLTRKAVTAVHHATTLPWSTELKTGGQQIATKKLTILFIGYRGRFYVSSLVRHLCLDRIEQCCLHTPTERGRQDCPPGTDSSIRSRLATYCNPL